MAASGTRNFAVMRLRLSSVSGMNTRQAAPGAMRSTIKWPGFQAQPGDAFVGVVDEAHASIPGARV